MIVKLRKSVVKLLPIAAVLLVLALVLSRVLTPGSSPAPEIRISANEASGHAGTVAEVCGDVASTSYLNNVEGNPAFINFEKPHPDQVFTIVIWGEHHELWQTPPHQLYENRSVCVTGRIDVHEGVPQITVHSPDRIQIQ
jgi:hypothetical protein